jgi:hypothetical protein
MAQTVLPTASLGNGRSKVFGVRRARPRDRASRPLGRGPILADAAVLAATAGEWVLASFRVKDR